MCQSLCLAAADINDSYREYSYMYIQQVYNHNVIAGCSLAVGGGGGGGRGEFTYRYTSKVIMDLLTIL